MTEKSVIAVVLGAPSYFLRYLAGLVFAILSEPALTSLFLGSAAIGLVTKPLIGVAAFFLGHVGIRIGSFLATAIVRVGK